ncbi:MAG TPA: GNAT family N-acetyltransferase [Candidatus Thermoplasmatota archaeon]|nr:GNAT family N-acetyltransferase [Candidatus Thermoplasmatota archaeon]
MAVFVEPNPDPAVAAASERAVGWPRTDAELARRFALPGSLHLVARDSKGPALATASCVVHDGWRDVAPGGLAWIGGMAVDAKARGRGLGAALLDGLLAHARARDVSVIGLDATREGRPLYERAGFGEVDVSERWSLPPSATAKPPATPPGDHAVYPISSCEIMDLVAFDAPRFGASRGPLLAALLAAFPERSFVTFSRSTGAITGLVCGQERHVGPWVADDPVAAAWLLHACVAAGTPPFVMAPRSNTRAAEALASLGYARDGIACARMTIGGPLRARRDAVYGIAAWALG